MRSGPSNEENSKCSHPISLNLVVGLQHDRVLCPIAFRHNRFPPSPRPATATEPQDHRYVGMWVTEDGRIRHELLANGRYDEARGRRESAYQGRYRVTGDIIQYWDDTGFYADGQFRGDILYHAGMVLYRVE